MNECALCVSVLVVSMCLSKLSIIKKDREEVDRKRKEQIESFDGLDGVCHYQHV